MNYLEEKKMVHHKRPARHVRMVRTKHGKKPRIVNPHIHHVHLKKGKKAVHGGFIHGIEDFESELSKALQDEEQAVIIVGKGVVKGTKDAGMGAVKVVTDVGDTAIHTADDVAKGTIHGASHAAKGGIHVVKGGSKLVFRKEI
jgi:hypothetical protein